LTVPTRSSKGRERDHFTGVDDVGIARTQMWPVEIDEAYPVLADLGGGGILNRDAEMTGDVPSSNGP
jgi:hypothetical protein